MKVFEYVRWPIRIILPFASPSQNRTDREHWSKRRRFWRGVPEYVTATARRAGVPAGMSPGVPMFVKITRFAKQRLDEGNFVGGCKALVDILVRAGLAEDDSPDWISIEYEQVRSIDPKTVIEIRPLSKSAESGFSADPLFAHGTPDRREHPHDSSGRKSVR